MPGRGRILHVEVDLPAPVMGGRYWNLMCWGWEAVLPVQQNRRRTNRVDPRRSPRRVYRMLHK